MTTQTVEFLHWLEYEKGRQPGTVRAYRWELARFAANPGPGPHRLGGGGQGPGARVPVLPGRNQREGRAGPHPGGAARLLRVPGAGRPPRPQPHGGDRNPQPDRKAPRYLTREEYQRLLETIQEYAMPSRQARDQAIVALFLGTGIRQGELVGLDLGDVDLVRRTVRVVRKGGDEQFVEFGATVQKHLEEYLLQRGNQPGPFFLSQRGAG